MSLTVQPDLSWPETDDPVNPEKTCAMFRNTVTKPKINALAFTSYY